MVCGFICQQRTAAPHEGRGNMDGERMVSILRLLQLRERLIEKGKIFVYFGMCLLPEESPGNVRQSRVKSQIFLLNKKIMKALRIILLVVACLWLVIVIMGVINFLRQPAPEGVGDDMANQVAWYVGSILGIVLVSLPTFICFYIARRIKRKLAVQSELENLDKLGE